MMKNVSLSHTKLKAHPKIEIYMKMKMKDFLINQKK